MTDIPQIKSIIQLFRPDLSLAAGICVIVGEIVALGNIPPIMDMFLGFAVGFFISSSTLILNDYFDLETDKINAPDRPLPSGLVKPSHVIILSAITAIIGLFAALSINLLALGVAIIFWIIGFLYNWKLKRTGLLGNLIVSSSVAITFIFGGIVVENPWNTMVWCFSAIAFFIDLGEEIGADALDMEGDKEINSQSIALKIGQNAAFQITAIIFAVVVLISFIPLILGGMGLNYLIMIIFMDIIIVFSTFKVLKSDNQKDKRKYLRWIYLGATLGLLGFIIGQIFA